MRLKLLTVTVVSLILAQSVVAATLVERFNSENEFSNGTIVSYQADSLEKVEPAHTGNLHRLVGSVVAENDELFQVRGDDKNLDLATHGVADILVSDENGFIESGSFLSVASVSGVAVRESGQSFILGTALEAFDENSEPVATVVLPDTGREVRVGRIQARIEVEINPNSDEFTASAPEALQNLANQLAGKPVSPVKVLAAFISMIITAAVGVALFFALESSTEDSQQRNPTEEKSLRRSERQLLVVVLGIFLLGIAFSFMLIIL